MQIHWPLVISTVCQRVGLGMFIIALLSNLALGLALPMNIVALATLALLCIGGVASIFHLKRPKRFFNAFSNIKSHLTQEAIITPFLGIALLICGLNGFVFDAGGAGIAIDVVTGLFALAFLVVTGFAYQMGSRPAWNTNFVIVLFLLTAAEAGAIATVALSLSFGAAVPMALTVTAFILLLVCIAAQLAYIARMRKVGYGVAVNPMEDPYRSTFYVWIAFGIVLTVVGTSAAILVSSAAIGFCALACSAIGIGAWTVLFFKGALKVKMFPMYPVDLNLDM